jgi:hypothetical protein
VKRFYKSRFVGEPKNDLPPRHKDTKVLFFMFFFVPWRLRGIKKKFGVMPYPFRHLNGSRLNNVPELVIL